MKSLLPADFTPELRLTLALLRSGLHRAATAPESPGVDWQLFVDTVERHRLAPFLQHHAAASLAAVAPPAIAARIAASAATNARRALAVMAVQLQLTRLLAEAGVPTLVVKGFPLAEQLHGGIGRRPVGDLDLFIRTADAARADAVLAGQGLRRTRPDFPLTPRQVQEFVRIKPEFEYFQPDPPLRIELLWRLEGLPETEDVWTHATTCSPGGRPVRTLPAGLNAVYLFQHGARHAWFRLFWLLDIARLLPRPDFDPAAVMALARPLGLERGVLQGALLCRDLLGMEIPPALECHPAERRVVARLTSEACRQIARVPALNEPVAEWLRQTAYRFRLPRTRRGKLAALVPHLASPLNWQTLPLSDRWFFLYPLLSPFLWCWRRLRRATAHAPRKSK